MKVRLLAASAALVLLASCSSSGDSDETSAPPSGSSGPGGSTSQTPPSTSSAPAGTSSAPSAGTVTERLLTAADLGSGYTGGPTQDDTPDPLPCTPAKPPLDTQVPPSGAADAGFKNTAGDVQISETVNEYGDDDTSQRAYVVATGGFDCASGKIDGEAIRIVKRPGSASVPGADSLTAWDFTDDKQFKGTAVAVKVGTRFVGLTFVAAPNAGGNVSVGAIVTKAVAKAQQS